MKKIALAVATLGLVMMTGSSFAANSLNAGTFGLNIPLITTTATTNTNIQSPLISGKYFLAKDMAVLGGVGFSSGGASGASSTTFALMGGMRKYLKVDDFAPFIGGFLGYETTSSNPSSSATTLTAEGGAEYFLAKQFSIEGKVGLGFRSVKRAAVKSTFFGTSTATLSVNYYF